MFIQDVESDVSLTPVGVSLWSGAFASKTKQCPYPMGQLNKWAISCMFLGFFLLLVIKVLDH